MIAIAITYATCAVDIKWYLEDGLPVVPSIIHCFDVQETKVIGTRTQRCCYCLSFGMEVSPIVPCHHHRLSVDISPSDHLA